MVMIVIGQVLFTLNGLFILGASQRKPREWVPILIAPTLQVLVTIGLYLSVCNYYAVPWYPIRNAL